ncbi:hypothetical protein N7448_000094 [Penicillium atrosanguineum]|uniref:ornithine decarboxylase n=1 Tax=Penicillium atrosanguineum TaxID=1132637 RepID=A0A9W9LBY5_9EURO|nr:uncharacterized protein N7443_003495 [Penicillium atrosanguineum]KAJ5148516.1 hypothetical protein N7448_000094 [Penicillium atrosanguineum]KAJ5303835.1 hypothetical protein N7443_003495 [Penicillium atrosanguineum]KAJ5323310.1 hypothetical protein N7476_001910 [Penicillium atrosanguineum]
MDVLPAQQKFFISEKIPVISKSAPSQLVDLAIESQISRITKQTVLGGDESFFVADLGQVTQQHRRWLRCLPGVQPYYAVKCNSDPTLLKFLANLGTGFDCASVEEMRAVLNLGVDPTRIIFANPCKSPASLTFARSTGIFCTTFDNIDELDSIKKHMPESQLILRIYANDDSALISFGEKFGAQLDTTASLLSRAWELGLEVIGVSFHVGTGAKNPNAFCRAIRDASIAFSEAERLGFKPTILDIGGGFQDDCFENAASAIRNSIGVEFPKGVTTIAEPGRYYACQAYTLITRVLSRRRQLGSAAASGIPDMLYQSDGVYGNFLNVIMEKERMVPRLIGGKKSLGEYRYSIWGPTCDSVDCVVKDARFNSEVKVGDWLRYDNMGAYTTTTSTQFNGFNSSHETFYVSSETLPGY